MERLLCFCSMLLCILWLSACTHTKEKNEMLAEWIGAPVTELQNHPYYSKLKLKKEKKNDSEILTYADGRPMVTKARCDALGGCVGIESWCENIFTVKDGVIKGLTLYGSCPFTKAARR